MFQQLISNRDKKALCLVCKELSSLVAYPLLYRNMSISSARMGGAFKWLRDNRGLQEIRTQDTPLQLSLTKL